MPAPTSPDRVTDPDAIGEGIVVAIEASTDVRTDAKGPGDARARVYDEDAPQGTKYPFVRVSLVSAVDASTYGSTILDTLWDITAYTADPKGGTSTTVARRLRKAALAAVLRTAWTATGWVIVERSIGGRGTGYRNVSPPPDGGTVFRGRQATVRVIARST